MDIHHLFVSFPCLEEFILSSAMEYQSLSFFTFFRRKPPSPEPVHRREGFSKPEASTNGKWSGPSHASQHGTFSAASPNSLDYDDMDEDHKSEGLDRR
jgi:hypothetical protein